LKRKVKPKPRASTKRVSGKTSSTTAAAVKTSKYFPSPLKGEQADIEEDAVTSAATAVRGNIKETKREEKEQQEEESEEDDGDDWEEVEELSGPLGPVETPEPVLPSQPVQIEIETPEVRKKKKRQAEFETYMRRMVNRLKKDVLVDTHKVHLLCLIANGMFRGRLCSEPDLLAITLSLLPAHFSMVAKERVDQNYLSGLLKWFTSTFTLNASLSCEESLNPRALLERRLASLSARNHQEMTHLFLLVLRSLRLFCRLVISLQPIPLKTPSAKTSQQTSKTISPEQKVSPGTKRPAGGGAVRGGHGGKKAKTEEIKEEYDEIKEKTKASGGQRPKNSKRRSVASKVSYKEDSESEGEEEEEEEEEGLSEDDFQATSEEDSEESERGAESAKSKKEKGKGKANVTKRNNKEDADEEEGAAGNGTKRRSGRKNDGPRADEWLEVYLVKTSSWVCVDTERGVGMPHLCSQNATAPITYVVSVDGDGFVKDLGRKYDPTWLTSSRKRRVDEEWWEETLQPFLGPEDERDMKEEKELQNKLLNKPLPVSIAEYKNHPLYALKRHLLKYEALYPSTATSLGYCRGEPVYSRDCVHTLHSKDTWLKEARTVRLGEEPYKMVRGFSNRSRKARMASEQKEENDLSLFGEWQTEEYQPPLAVGGKVPRNEYGNVYLFKPCMIPVGCVHLKLPNLHRVARKLNMDAAPAVTDQISAEHEEILRAAWVEDQEIQKQKEKEKKEKRVISNWTVLVKGLLIRERLKQRYGKKNQGLGNLQETCGLSSDEEVPEAASPSAKTASETLAMSWPQNRQAEEEEDGGSISGLKRKTKTTKREKKGQEKHMFPFEKV
uniref:Xeroderma pigmentosum, complementation group C n=1 Tax=Gasterosteus aculeatus aculeatus TaxID=481459 RepID=A0AAQ4S5U7_GASAC